MNDGQRSLSSRTSVRIAALALGAITAAALPIAGQSSGDVTARSGFRTRPLCDRRAVLPAQTRRDVIEAAFGTPGDVDIGFLATDGCSATVLAQLRRLAAYVQFSDTQVGYVHAILPSHRVLEAIDLVGVVSIGVIAAHDSKPVTAYTPSSTPVADFSLLIPTVARSLTANGPYFASEEAGLDALRQRYPEADGRGTRIAFVDASVDASIDLLHPALQRVRSADGVLVPKVVDIVMPFDSLDPQQGGDWVLFGNPMTPTHGRLFFAGRSWTVPGAGPYKVGLFHQELTVRGNHSYGSDGYPNTSTLALNVGVLWDPATDHVWIDTDGDGDFTDNSPLTDYGDHHELGWFGRVDTAADNRIPFGVKIDRVHNAIGIGIRGSHGTWVSGPAAANRLTGGLFDGAAPEAQIVSVQNLYSRAGLIDGIAAAAARPDVDVINRSGGIGGWTSDGYPEFQRAVIERIIRIYDKPVVCACPIPGAISVSDYQSPTMLRRNAQAPPPRLPAITWGETDLAADGLVNQLIVPSSSLVTESRYRPSEITLADGTRRVTDANRPHSEDWPASPAPDGYAIGANPSSTIGFASGVVAAVISLAKQHHVRYDVDRLTNAMFTGATLVAGFQTDEQGRGLINADGAWERLVAMTRADDPRSRVLTGFHVERERDGHRVRVQGWSMQYGERALTDSARIWVSRHGGYTGARAYTLRLRGDTSAFTLVDTSLALVQGHEHAIRFRVHAGAGRHLGFVQLTDVAARAVMTEIPLYLEGPDRALAIAPAVKRVEVTIPPRHTARLTYAIGAAAQAVRVRLDMPDIGIKYGLPLWNARTLYSRNSNHVVQGLFAMSSATDSSQISGTASDGRDPPKVYQATVIDPFATELGLYLAARGMPEYETPYDPPAPAGPTTATVTFSEYAVSLVATDRDTVLAENRCAEIDGHVVLFDGVVTTRKAGGAGPHAMATVDTHMPDSTAFWRIAVASDTVVEADAYALDCTRGAAACTVAATAPLHEGSATLSVTGPKTGVWRVVVMRRADGGTARYTIRQVALTEVPTSEVSRHQPGGSRWSVPLPARAIQPNHAVYAGFRVDSVSVDLLNAIIGHANADRTVIGMSPLRGDGP